MNSDKPFKPRLRTYRLCCDQLRWRHGTPSNESTRLRINLPLLRVFLCIATALAVRPPVVSAAELRAGVAKVDITDRAAGPVNDPLFAKALVVKNEAATAVLITIDAVAIGEIGRIGNDFLASVRERLQKELGIPPSSVLINASHCPRRRAARIPCR